ncbi:hypothetical protein ILYODFUR_016563 [Ilyodon furcidens]|uniref:Uncharacterized protein n=2 Tax=Goodeidae TaxID=28758 RepID=A0ABV0VHL4_9TELE
MSGAGCGTTSSWLLPTLQSSDTADVQLKTSGLLHPDCSSSLVYPRFQTGSYFAFRFSNQCLFSSFGWFVFPLIPGFSKAKSCLMSYGEPVSDPNGQLPGWLKVQGSGLHVILSLRLDSGLLNTGGSSAEMSSLSLIKTLEGIECLMIMLPETHRFLLDPVWCRHHAGDTDLCAPHLFASIQQETPPNE